MFDRDSGRPCFIGPDRDGPIKTSTIKVGHERITHGDVIVHAGFKTSHDYEPRFRNIMNQSKTRLKQAYSRFEPSTVALFPLKNI